MSKRHSPSCPHLYRNVCAVAVIAITATACSASEPDSGVVAAEALSRSTNIVQIQELGGLHMLDGLAQWKVKVGPALCDEQPKVEIQQHCGRKLPAKVVFEWQGCDALGPPQANGAEGAAPSSGKVTISTALSSDAAEPCAEGATWNIDRIATVAIEHEAADGRRIVMNGHFEMAGMRALGGDTFEGQISIDSTRRIFDADGEVVREMKMSGELTNAYEQRNDILTRIVNGIMNVTTPRGDSGEMVFSEVALPDPETCRWPLAGTVTRTLDDTSHRLVFGPNCGSATLDGEVVDLAKMSKRSRGRRPGR